MNKKIKLENNTLNYKEYWKKNKDIVLLIHWWWWSSDSWTKVWEILEEKGYRVLIPDLPWSTKMELDKVYTLKDIAILVEEFVEKMLFKDFVLWWHSNGWAVSIVLAERQRLYIKKLVLNNSAWIRKDARRSLKRKVLWKVVKIAKPLKKVKVLNKARTIFYKAIGSHDYLKAETNPYLKQTYLNMISSDLQIEMKDVRDDTLLIRWKDDSYTPVSDAKKINNLIKGSRLVILDNERHGIHLDSPEKLVEAFLWARF